MSKGRPTNQEFYNFFVKNKHLPDDRLLELMMSLGFTHKNRLMVKDLIQTTRKSRK